MKGIIAEVATVNVMVKYKIIVHGRRKVFQVGGTQFQLLVLPVTQRA